MVIYPGRSCLYQHTAPYVDKVGTVLSYIFYFIKYFIFISKTATSTESKQRIEYIRFLEIFKRESKRNTVMSSIRTATNNLSVVQQIIYQRILGKIDQ